MNRHGRQMLLAEVGAAGQARIASALAQVPGDGVAALVAARYLAGAGVGRILVRSAALAAAAARVDAALPIQVDPLLPAAAADNAFDLRDPAARAVASGARTALRILRGILDGPPAGDGS
jgi:hypothetical protein